MIICGLAARFGPARISGPPHDTSSLTGIRTDEGICAASLARSRRRTASVCRPREAPSARAIPAALQKLVVADVAEHVRMLERCQLIRHDRPGNDDDVVAGGPADTRHWRGRRGPAADDHVAGHPVDVAVHRRCTMRFRSSSTSASVRRRRRRACRHRPGSHDRLRPMTGRVERADLAEPDGRDW